MKIIDVIKHKNMYSTQTFLVLDEKPEFKYERAGDFLIGEDSGFYYFYGYRKSTEAFCGREFDIPLLGGGVEKASGQWWHCMPDDYKELVCPLAAGTKKELGECNVFSSIYADYELLEQWMASNEPSNNYHKYESRNKAFGVRRIDSKWD
jgi:hypothetical protein